MLIAGVIRNKVHNDLESSLFRLSCQFFEVVHGAEYRVDVSVAGNIVAEVRHGGLVDWGQPEGLNTNLHQMIQSVCDSSQVTGPVIIRVLEGARVDLVDDRTLPPLYKIIR